MLEYENFNAAVARVTFNGRNVHPGYAKHKMINSMRIANQFVIMSGLNAMRIFPCLISGCCIR